MIYDMQLISDTVKGAERWRGERARGVAGGQTDKQGVLSLQLKAADNGHAAPDNPAPFRPPEPLGFQRLTIAIILSTHFDGCLCGF